MKSEKKVNRNALPQKQSSVIRPGTGSGSKPNGGSLKTPTSEAMNNHTMGRVDPPSGWLK